MPDRNDSPSEARKRALDPEARAMRRSLIAEHRDTIRRLELRIARYEQDMKGRRR